MGNKAFARFPPPKAGLSFVFLALLLIPYSISFLAAGK